MIAEIDNTQETKNILTDAEWGWLGGLMDGEGSIHMTIRRKRMNKWSGYGVDLGISLGNTDSRIIKRFTDLISKMGVSFHMHDVSPKNLTKKVMTYVQICKMTHIYMFLSGIKDYLFSDKREKSELIIQFIERRKSYQTPRSKKGACWYVKKDWDIVKKFHDLKRAKLPKDIEGFLRDQTCSSKVA